eukprot:IDg7480t1
MSCDLPCSSILRQKATMAHYPKPKSEASMDCNIASNAANIDLSARHRHRDERSADVFSSNRCSSILSTTHTDDITKDSIG